MFWVRKTPQNERKAAAVFRSMTVKTDSNIDLNPEINLVREHDAVS